MDEVPAVFPDGAGAAQVGLRQVARAAGVSTATVSRAINRPEVVSPAARERIARGDPAARLGAGRRGPRTDNGPLPHRRRGLPDALRR